MAHFAELESKVDPTGHTADTHLIVKRVNIFWWRQLETNFL